MGDFGDRRRVVVLRALSLAHRETYAFAATVVARQVIVPYITPETPLNTVTNVIIYSVSRHIRVLRKYYSNSNDRCVLFTPHLAEVTMWAVESQDICTMLTQ